VTAVRDSAYLVFPRPNLFVFSTDPINLTWSSPDTLPSCALLVFFLFFFFPHPSGTHLCANRRLQRRPPTCHLFLCHPRLMLTFDRMACTLFCPFFPVGYSACGAFGFCVCSSLPPWTFTYVPSYPEATSSCLSGIGWTVMGVKMSLCG